MSIFIQHRVNTLAALGEASPEGGCEVDLRSQPGHKNKFQISHDPWLEGENFESWLSLYVKRKFKGPLILNTKEDGLEMQLIEIMAAHGIVDFFFLDTTVPSLASLLALGHGKHLCLRCSVLEPVNSITAWQKFTEKQRSFAMPRWIWLDCFGGKPMAAKDVQSLLHKLPNLSICLVSPELQHASLSNISQFIELSKLSSHICTKRPDIWKDALLV